MPQPDPPPPHARRRHALLAALAGLAAITAVIVALIASGHGRRPGTTSTVRGRPSPPARPTSTAPRTPPPARTDPSGEQLGANVNWLFNGRDYPQQRIDAQLAALSDTGATIARSDAIWGYAEPRPPVAGVHSYDWSFDDLVAGSLAAHGLSWLPIVDYAAPWAQAVPGNLHSPPRTPSDYAAYAAALATRYGPGGAFWREHPSLDAKPVQTLEIWNEPDNREFWPPAPDAGRYAALYQQAQEAVTGANPAVHVIVGGLTNPRHFIPALVSAAPELRSEIDGVAVHPYAATPNGVLARVRVARDALRAAGLAAVPLYVTELGWRTSPPEVPYYASAPRRRRYIERAFDALAHTDCKIATIVVYTWMTPAHQPAHGGDWYGINPPDGPSAEDDAVLAKAISEADSNGSTSPACAQRP